MTKLINLTPHPLTLRDANGEDTVIPPSGAVARVAMVAGALEHVEGVPIPIAGADQPGPVQGLGEPRPGVLYIVSAMVGSYCRGRHDVVVPGTGPADGAIRNAKGHIAAVTRLKRV